MRRRFVALFAGVLASGAVSALPERASLDAQDAVARLQARAEGHLVAVTRPREAYTVLRATRGRHLMTDTATGSAEERARIFLSLHGAALGVTDPATQLRRQRISRDAAGNAHVHLDQVHSGVPVFGARIVVHMNGAGIYGVNGVFLPRLESLSTTPTIGIAQLRETALTHAAKGRNGRALRIEASRFVVYPVGLLEGRLRGARLAYEVSIVAEPGRDVREWIFVDARSGAVLNRVNRIHSVLNREIYTPDDTGPPYYTEKSLVPPAPADPPLVDNQTDGPGPYESDRPGRPPLDNLYIFAGGTYTLYYNLFGRDGYDDCDGTGPCKPDAEQVQKSIYLINDACPNAYWDGEATNYCPGFDADDVVSHEWSHGYTEYTAGLIYQYQSGALNESYSDIFGETYDLVNNEEGPLGASLIEGSYWEDFGSRWVVGEDLSEEAASVLLRDMWKPDDFCGAAVCLPSPGKVSSDNYACGFSDGGGVHTNSGVPNHAYAMLVDGTTGQGPAGSAPAERNSYNGHTFTGMGVTKAAHIYFQAHSTYETPSTNFAHHAEALLAACNDLIGVNLKGLVDGQPTGQMITQADCDKVQSAVTAVGMGESTPCGYVLLKPESETPDACPAGAASNTIFSETWEGGAIPAGWTLTTETGPTGNSFPDTNWEVRSALPEPHTGKAAFAFDSPGGNCSDDDISGHFSLDTPAITLAGAGDKRLVFTHYLHSELAYDGGNLKYSLNDGAFEVVPGGAFTHNGYNGAFAGAIDSSTNPLAGEPAWTGGQTGESYALWFTTIVDVTAVGAAPGDTIKFRWDFGQDGCGGVDGWYVDEVKVLACAALDPPVLSLGADYEDPDVDGEFTLSWTRPGGATGPEQLQTSQDACAPLFTDNAASLANWTAATVGTPSPIWTTSSTKPNHEGNSAFWANPVSEQETQNSSATLTLNQALTLPPGTTTLSFNEWYFNEDDDRGHVEVSTDNGNTWSAVYTNARLMGALPDEGAAAFADEDLTRTTMDLSAFAGQTIRLRFNFALGESNFFFFTQYGWYIDDISIANENWQDLPTGAGTSQLLTDLPGGSACYRVRTTWPGNQQSPYSNVVTADVDINRLPIAAAGADRTVDESTADVTLVGTGSSDPDGDTITYAWTQVSGAPVTLADADKATASFDAPEVCATENLVFRLTVSDGLGSASDDVTLTIENVNQAPVAAAGPDQTLDEGASGVLSAAATTDADCETLTYAWTQVTGPSVTLNNAATAMASFTAPQVDEDAFLGFRLEVTDTAGASSVDFVSVSVRNVAAAEPAPVISDQRVGGCLSPAALLVVGLLGLLRLRRRGGLMRFSQPGTTARR